MEKSEEKESNNKSESPLGSLALLKEIINSREIDVPSYIRRPGYPFLKDYVDYFMYDFEEDFVELMARLYGGDFLEAEADIATYKSKLCDLMGLFSLSNKYGDKISVDTKDGEKIIEIENLDPSKLIKVQGKYVFSDDERLLRLDSGTVIIEGTDRVFVDIDGKTCLEGEFVILHDGRRVIARSQRKIVTLGINSRRYALASECEKHFSRYFLKGEEKVLHFSRNYKIPKSLAVKAAKFYGKDVYLDTCKDSIFTYKGEKWESPVEVLKVEDYEKGSVDHSTIPKALIKSLDNFFVASKDSFKSLFVQTDKGIRMSSYNSYSGLYFLVSGSKKGYKLIPNTGIYVKKADFKECLDYFNNLINSEKNLGMLEEMKEHAEGYDPSDLKIAGQYRTYPASIIGGETYFSPISKFTPSPSRKMTSGIGYTFGVELETSSGEMNDPICQELSLSKVGDGSVRAMEYVTGILHGDTGLRSMGRILEEMKRQTTYNNNCGIHIHVGGTSLTDSPIFNNDFMAHAIKLGTLIEEDLYKHLPPHREPYQRYCANITKNATTYSHKGDGESFDFSDINLDDPKNAVARYVHGAESLSRELNKSSRLNRWDRARYRWLNLVNCSTDNSRRRSSSFRTIEFRIFPMTHSFDEFYTYLMISLAFVKYVENNKRKIREGNVTLESMLEETLWGKSYAIVSRVLSKNKELYNRKEVY